MNPEDESLEIIKMETSKDGIIQRPWMKYGIIPKHPCNALFSGCAGSGKTTLIVNLLKRGIFYGPSYYGMQIRNEEGELLKGLEPKKYHDIVILCIGSEDDMYEDLIKSKIIDIVHRNTTPATLLKIINAQEKLFYRAQKDITKVPKILVILDDMASKDKLLNSEPSRQLSIKNRHLNMSVWYVTQYINMIPKRTREQCVDVFLFRPSKQCYDVICEQFQDPDTPKKEFMAMIKHCTDATNDQHNFMAINKSVSPEKRFRKNLDIYVVPGSSTYQPTTLKIEPGEVRDESKEHESKEQEIVESKPEEPKGAGNKYVGVEEKRGSMRKYYRAGGRTVQFS